MRRKNGAEFERIQKELQKLMCVQLELQLETQRRLVELGADGKEAVDPGLKSKFDKLLLRLQQFPIDIEAMSADESKKILDRLEADVSEFKKRFEAR